MITPPGSIPFGDVGVRSSRSIRVELANAGGDDLEVNDIRVIDPARPFTVTLPPLPATVAPGATATFELVFRPVALGPGGASRPLDAPALLVAYVLGWVARRRRRA